MIEITRCRLCQSLRRGNPAQSFYARVRQAHLATGVPQQKRRRSWRFSVCDANQPGRSAPPGQKLASKSLVPWPVWHRRVGNSIGATHHRLTISGFRRNRLQQIRSMICVNNRRILQCESSVYRVILPQFQRQTQTISAPAFCRRELHDPRHQAFKF